MTADEYRTATYTQIKQGENGGNGWCPQIYFNHRCFSGPFLSKGRIAELPKCVGPGPVTLVMTEVKEIAFRKIGVVMYIVRWVVVKLIGLSLFLFITDFQTSFSCLLLPAI